MPDIAAFSLAAATGYLFGAVPFGLVLTQMAGVGDIRQIGSGNIGATNVLRTGRRDLAAATLFLDMFKAGIIAFVFWRIFGKDVGMVAGAAALVGHCYPIWLNFKGGKGVATYAGLVVVTTLPGFLIGAPLWIGVFALSRISSLAALITAFTIPIALAVTGELGWLPESPFVIGVFALLTALLFWRHRENIARLIRGEEPRFGASK
ncbi:MAG: glycerol-3-phosphate 1-O-acyltransferase PlsY [Pseudomonadota bacterium]